MKKKKTYHEIIDRIAKQIVSVCKELKLRIHPTLRRQISHLLIPLSSFTFVL